MRHRVAGKAYDAALRSYGLRNTQFTLLAALEIEGEKPIGLLAEALGTDPTTLSRNLDVLEMRVLVELVAHSNDGCSRVVRITQKGSAVYASALPACQSTQAALLAACTPDTWDATMCVLNKIEKSSTI